MTATSFPAPAAAQALLLPRLLESACEASHAATIALADYWAAAVRRQAWPLAVAHDVARWWDTAARRERPRWHTPNDIVLTAPVARLRDFSGGSRSRVVPTLVLPPQAGHDSCIVDYSPRQSQIRAIRDAGLERVYSLDWIGATGATRDAGIEDYLDVIERSVRHVGGPVNLVGDCQGGWLAAIYAALRPHDVNTLTVAGAPIDFHAGDAVIHDWVRALDGLDLAFYRWVVAAGGGVLKGEHMLNGFVLMKPENEVAKQVALLANLDDDDHVERYRAFEAWFKHTQDIPGRFYLWIVEHLFRDNKLLRGDLEIGGERVDLRRISCPLNLLAGAKDHITPPEQVFAMAGGVSTPPEQVVRRTTTGGHLGLFMGSEALRDHWPPLLAAVRERSAPAGS
jgi:poly(3-hydroxyalkanoate) synthetase